MVPAIRASSASAGRRDMFSFWPQERGRGQGLVAESRERSPQVTGESARISRRVQGLTLLEKEVLRIEGMKLDVD